MNELMESQETIQRRSRLIGYAFDAAKTGQPMTLICRSVEEQNDLFARLKDLLSQQRITCIINLTAVKKSFCQSLQ